MKNLNFRRFFSASIYRTGGSVYEVSYPCIHVIYFQACFDVREGSVFWEKMNIAADLQNTNIPEWLSTHPSHGNRVELFDFLLPRVSFEYFLLNSFDHYYQILLIFKAIYYHATNSLAKA